MESGFLGTSSFIICKTEIPDGTVYKLVLKEPIYTKGLLKDGSKAL